MTINTRLKLNFLWLLSTFGKAKRVAKKIRKNPEQDTHPAQWRTNFVLKKASKFNKIFKLDITVKGKEDLPKGTFILAPNHTSAFDSTVLMEAMKNDDPTEKGRNRQLLFLAKEELKKERFGSFMDVINTFYINRKKPRESLRIIEEMLQYAKDENKIAVIFPDGTRSEDGTIQDFKSGAFVGAKSKYLPIVPVTINNTLSASDKTRTGKLNIEIIFHKQVKPSSVLAMKPKDIAVKIQKIVQSGWVKPEGKRAAVETEIVKRSE